MKFTVAHTDNLVRFWRSQVKGQRSQLAVEVVKASTSTLGRGSPIF